MEERQAAQDELERIKTKLKAESARQNAAQLALNEVVREKEVSVSRHVQLELDIKELEDKRSSDATTQVRSHETMLANPCKYSEANLCCGLQDDCKKQLKALEKEIAHAEKDLKAAKASLDAKQAAVDQVTSQVDVAQRRLQANFNCF